MLLSWSYCENGWGIIRTDVNGRKLWGSKDPADHLAVSADGKRFFAAVSKNRPPSNFVVPTQAFHPPRSTPPASCRPSTA